jgi:hypothetical protein
MHYTRIYIHIARGFQAKMYTYTCAEPGSGNPAKRTDSCRAVLIDAASGREAGRINEGRLSSQAQPLEAKNSTGDKHPRHLRGRLFIKDLVYTRSEALEYVSPDQYDPCPS